MIAGVLFLKKQAVPADICLDRMLTIQRHRDISSPQKIFGNYYAFGMANSKNCISERNQSKDCSSHDKIYAFVDGVVLNVDELKREFEKDGFVIPVVSCSAIIEVAYKKWGLKFINELEGEFSCAIWDEEEKRLILTRDPYGHKPLHYYADSEKVAFSSEIKGILAAGINREINLVALSDFLTLNCIPGPQTIFKDIWQVKPGGMVVISSEGVELCEFWKNEFCIQDQMDLETATTMFTERFKDAVKKRMISQETFCFLSGGIDSSAVVSFAAEISSKPIHAVCVSFDEAEVNEFEFAKLMSDHVGAQLHHVVAKPNSFFEMLDTLVFYHDLPFTDTSAFPTFYAAKLARQSTDLILTGDGSDQLLGGSDHFVDAINNDILRERGAIQRKFSGLVARGVEVFAKGVEPSILTRIKRKFYRDSYSSVHALYNLRSFFPDIVKRELCCPDLWRVHLKNDPYRYPRSWFASAGGQDSLNKYLYADVQFYLPDDLMIKVDRMCMANNLETLSPFQDISLARFINTLPSKYKIHVSKNKTITTKYILKQVCKNRFPPAILQKRKQGFGIPLVKWLRQRDGDYLKNILFDPKSLNRNLFRREMLETFVNDFSEGKGDYFYPSPGGIVALLTLELWHRKYWDQSQW